MRSIPLDLLRFQEGLWYTLMGALPNTFPQQSRKPAARAPRSSKLNQYGRDPLSPSERLRASSDFEKETGYSPFYHAFLADLPRLSSGNSCTLLLLTLWAKSAGRGAKKGQARPEWTLALSVEDLAQICRCDVRTIERELVALEKRGLGEVRRPGKGQIEARLKYREWEALPDYKSQVVEMSPAEEAAPDPETVDETKPGNQRVTGKRPARIAAGSVSKVFPVSCGVRSFRYKADGPVDLDITAVIQAGELVVSSRLPEEIAKQWEIWKASPNVSSDLTSPARHGRREDEPNVGRRSAPVNHPRAAELNRIFDPVLAHSAASLLSMDGSRKHLQAACEAIGDCDHEYLAKFAGTRKIKSVALVPTICAEALASWKASKVLAGAGAVTKEQIDAMVAKEKADLERQRAEFKARKGKR